MSQITDHRLELLEKRVEVMQQEVRKVLEVVNSDLQLFFETVTRALQATDARMDKLEGKSLAVDQKVPIESREGKEL